LTQLHISLWPLWPLCQDFDANFHQLLATARALRWHH
jgi:hypothetical protein